MRYATMILLGAVNVEYHMTPSRIDAAIAAMLGVGNSGGGKNCGEACRCSIM